MEHDHTQPFIAIKNLKKRFGENIVLDGVNLDIPQGSIFSILGKSGTGKSVLIKCLIDVLHADSGEIWYNGHNLLAVNKKIRHRLNKDYAYLFQESALFDSLSVFNNVAFPIREVLGIKDKHFIRTRVEELLDWVNLSGTSHLMPSELSGGMKKRTGFARTLAMNPKVMLCDEPTTGLDPVTGRTIMDLIIKANKELGITCLIISHDVAESLRASDYLAFLDEGKIRALGDNHSFIDHDYPLLSDFITNALVDKKSYG